jgi:serine/threonine-protein kinase
MTIQPRRQVGGYEVIEHIGSGGMGEVYHGRDPVLRRDVALKFLLPRLATDHERLDRFRREAQALAALNHPNIAQIFAL